MLTRYNKTTQHFANDLAPTSVHSVIAYDYLMFIWLFDWQLLLTCCCISCGWLWSCCLSGRPVQSHVSYRHHVSLSTRVWTLCFLTPSLSLLTSACHDTRFTHTHPNTFTYAATIHQSSTSSVFMAWLNIENYSAAPKHTLMNFSWVSKQMGGGKDAGGVREDTHLLL